MNRYHGRSRLALLPKSAQEVSDILKYCNKRKLAVVPQVRVRSCTRCTSFLALCPSLDIAGKPVSSNY